MSMSGSVIVSSNLVAPERTKHLILGGVEYSGDTTQTLTILYPADGTTEVGRCQLLEEQQFEDVLNFAEEGFQHFRKTPVSERRLILERLAQALDDNAVDLAKLITLECGKPIRLAQTEVQRAIDLCRGYADRLTHVSRETIILEDTEAQIQYFPLGPILAITPFNFPLNLIVHKLAPAIAAGCSITIKPSPRTPLTALYLGRLAIESGYWSLNVVPCQDEMTKRLVQAHVFQKITFTGSAKVGWHLKSLAPKKSFTLELGGNAACIIEDFKFNQLESLAKEVADGAFAFSGQSCIAVQRVFVQQALYETFLPALVDATRALQVGDPFHIKTDIGPMITTDDVFRTRELIRQAIHQGANVVYGGNSFNTFTMNPTIFNRTTPEMTINQEECFAPIVTVTPYETLSEAFSWVNDSRYGLQAGIYTLDMEKAKQAYDILDVGGLTVNQVPTRRLDLLPYGGIKDSGLGREGILASISDFSYLKTLSYKMYPNK